MNRAPVTGSKSVERNFFLSAFALLAAALVTGLLAAVVSVRPDLLRDVFPFARLQPLHTFLSMTGLLAGTLGLMQTMRLSAEMERSTPKHRPHRIPLMTFLTFCLFGIIAIISGHATGREYFSWPAPLTLILLLPLSWFAFAHFAAYSHLVSRSPEGFWLVGTGVMLLIGGIVESHLWLFRDIGDNFTKDLTVQWHGIDAYFAGLNATMLGTTVFLLREQATALRPIALFAIAAFSILLTFGHHHYASPQPRALKILALLASLAAALSLVRHSRAFLKTKSTDSAPAFRPLIRSIEFWTIVATASGIAFAIPQLNLYIHGTYLVTAHAMLSLIGVNVLVVLLGGYIALVGARDQDADPIRRAVFWLNTSLCLAWLSLGAAGAVRGFLRIEKEFQEYANLMRLMLLPLPVAGLGVIWGYVGLMRVIFSKEPASQQIVVIKK